MNIYICVYIQLTLESRGLNCMDPLIRRFLFMANTIKLHDPEMIEPIDSEDLWILRTNYKLYKTSDCAEGQCT